MAAPHDLSIAILFSSFLFLLSGSTPWVHGSSHSLNHNKPSKLFVFGDSFVDTGNTPKSTHSWKVPYGITFPGKPSGRFSDGRVWTDYIAAFLRIKSPVPYMLRKKARGELLKYGMNFAFGGAGVFNTSSGFPNISTQIDYFDEMIKSKVYTSVDLHSSVALVSLTINDYLTYFFNNGSATSQGYKRIITEVVKQLVVDLKRIQATGVKRIAVDGLHPVGCIPYVAAETSYKCDKPTNELVLSHNLLLRQSIAKLNNQTKEETFLFLDLYTAFFAAFKSQDKYPGSLKFKNPLKPCCAGKSSKYNCGDVGANGLRKYTVCKKADSSFFWDNFHPTQQGWRDVYLALQPTIQKI